MQLVAKDLKQSLELHQIDEKMVFLNGDLQEKFTWNNPKILSWKERTYGRPPEEIHLSIKSSLQTVVFKVLVQ